MYIHLNYQKTIISIPRMHIDIFCSYCNDTPKLVCRILNYQNHRVIAQPGPQVVQADGLT